MALRKLRKAMKPVIWAVTIAFVISIFFIGAGSMSGRNQGEALKVNGKKLSKLRIDRSVRNNMDRYQNYFKGMALDNDIITLLTISGLVELQFLNEEANSKERKVEKKVIDEKLKEMTGFADLNKLKKTLANRNLSLKDIEKEVRESLVAEKVRERLTNVATPSAVDVEAYYALTASNYGNKTFADVKAQVEKDLKQRDGQRAYNKWLEDKYAKAKIKAADEFKRFVKSAVLKAGSFDIDNIEFYNNVFYKKVYFGMTEDKAAFGGVIDNIKEDVAAAEEAQTRGLKPANFDKLSKQDKIAELTMLLKEALKKEVKYTDADLEKYFKDAAKGKYDQQESANAKIVSFKIEPSDADKKSAADKADAILKEAIAGKDFAELAKANSKDPGSAVNGGDLGWFGKGQMVPEFETAAFETAKGTVYSKVVKSQFGYHIIKVDDKNDAEGKVKARHILIRDEVGADTKKSIGDKAAALLEEIKAGKTTMDAAMKEKSQADKKEEIINISKGGYVDGVGYDKALNDAIFAMKEGESKIVTSETGVYIVEVTKYVPFKAAVFAEVKGAITADYLNEKSTEALNALKASKKESVKIEITDEKIKNAIK